VRAHGGGNRRLALDKADRDGIAALAAEGLSLHDGQEVMELARAIKSADEIRAMRCALATCEAAMAAMQAALRPGMSEQELWARLHAENVRRGGEWIETRLLSSGPRTNPWFQECSSRMIDAGDLVAFDTDLIGPYGYCADISRTWLCGRDRASAAQIDLYCLAQEQIAHNLALIRPGLGLREFSERAFRLPERYRANRYSTIAHGVGLCDEYPAVYYPEDHAETGYDGVLEAGMTICLESYVGAAGGPDGVKLEQQLLVTQTGAELLSAYPLEQETFR
jgi:Xaa-Pro dipeptidase